MQQKFGVFTLSFIDKETFYHYIGAVAEGRKGRGDTVRNERGAEMHELLVANRFREMYALGSNDIKAQIQHNTYNLFTTWLDNHKENADSGSSTLSMLQNKKKTTYFEATKTICTAISKIQNQIYSQLLLALLPILLFLYFKNRKIPLSIFYLSIFLLFISYYIMAVSAVSFWQGDRFLVPLVPYTLIILAGVWRLFYGKKEEI